MTAPTIPEADLNVETALSRAPVTKGFPAITPEFLALLKHRGASWEAQGIRVTRPTPERFCSFLTPFAATRRGTVVWWIGDSAARCVCSPGDFAALLKGRALKDGSVMAGGEARRLHYSNGWASLVPRVVVDPGEVRRHFVTLTNSVLGFVGRMDPLMKQPATNERGAAVGKLMSALENANDAARYFGLGVNHRTDKRKPLKGGVR